MSNDANLKGFMNLEDKLNKRLNDRIETSEIRALFERLDDAAASTSAASCFRAVLDEIADDIGSSDVSAVCAALAAKGRRWRGYECMHLVCDVLERADGTCAAIWLLVDEEFAADAILCTFGDLLEAFRNDGIPAWFPLECVKVYDSKRNEWLPRWSFSGTHDGLMAGPAPSVTGVRGKH